MDMNDELSLRELLDDKMLDTTREIENDDSDLGEWKYAIFRAEGLRNGDKGILGYQKECSPYVVMYNDLIMVFFHNNPTDDELNIGPITVKREMLNDWCSAEKSMTIGRRWFWDVRDWLDESSYDYYDPAREKALIAVREKERSEGRVIGDKVKKEAIKAVRIKMGPKSKMFRIRKLQRIFIASKREMEAAEKGMSYDPLKDEELFLQQRDFDMYYQDLAALSRREDQHDRIVKFPYYEKARRSIPDEREWAVRADEDVEDPEYLNAMKDVIDGMSTKELDHLVNGVPEPYINPFARIGRNDPCPCGSGKKFKKCCGRGL